MKSSTKNNSDYESKLFDIFYQSRVRQDVELDRHKHDNEAFRAETRQRFDGWRSNPQSIWIVIERGGSPIAYATCDYNNVTKELGIGDLCVDIAYRHEGVGRELLLAVKGRACKLGATSLFLTVNQDNAEAIHLYKSFGFMLRANPYLDMTLRIG